MLLLVLLLPFVQAFDPTAYTNSTVVSPTYTLHWRINSTAAEIFLAIEAQTLGWVGFGLAESSSGSMQGSDIVIGWFANGVAQIQDLHALAKEQPPVDSCQDWVLVSGEESANTTIIEVKRKLDTGDPQDRPVLPGSLRAVWAHSSDNRDVFAYHGGNRQAFAIVLLGEPARDPLDGLRNDPNVFYFDLTNNFSLMATETHYERLDFQLPVLQQPGVPAHIIGFEALVQPATKRYVHHFVASGYYNLSNLDQRPLLWAWAPGVTGLVLPADAGFLISSGPNGLKRLHLETHYDNPGLVTGPVDQSGIRIYYTHNLRTHDAGVMQLGDPNVMVPYPIPSGSGTFKVEFSCGSGCTSKWTSMNVFNVFLHMHARGSQIWSTQWRGDTRVREIGRTDFWDFGFQLPIDTNIQILPGDRINTHCVYLKHPTNQVAFGLGSHDEMCIQYLMYYPRMPGSGYCGYFWVPEMAQFNLPNGTFCNDDALWDANHVFPLPDTVKDPPLSIQRSFGDLAAAPRGYKCPTADGNSALSLAPTLFSLIALAVTYVAFW